VAGELPALRLRSDFYPEHEGESHLPLLVHACPRCGFAGEQPAFARGGLSEDQRTRVLRELEPRVREFKEEPPPPNGAQHALAALMPRCASSLRDRVPGRVKYLCAARVAEWLGEKEARVADYLLKACWCCEEEGVSDPKLLRAAAEKYEKALSRPDGVSPQQRAVVAYLVGELYRRLGEPAKAVSWFHAVDREIVDSERQAWISAAARRQETAPEEWLGQAVDCRL
jgi:hypothetical protein